jgi:hypothetical protein
MKEQQNDLLNNFKQPNMQVTALGEKRRGKIYLKK